MRTDDREQLAQHKLPDNDNHDSDADDIVQHACSVLSAWVHSSLL